MIVVADLMDIPITCSVKVRVILDRNQGPSNGRNAAEWTTTKECPTFDYEQRECLFECRFTRYDRLMMSQIQSFSIGEFYDAFHITNPIFSDCEFSDLFYIRNLSCSGVMLSVLMTLQAEVNLVGDTVISLIQVIKKYGTQPIIEMNYNQTMKVSWICDNQSEFLIQ